VGPNIVRAWIDTVISPLLDGLGEEESRLREARWGWEPRPPVLRSAHRTRDYLDVRAWKNLEQMFDFVPDLAPIVVKHDEQAEALLARFVTLQQEIENSEELRDAYRQVKRAMQAKYGVDSELLSETNESTDRTYLAAYILNDYDQLYSYYALAPVWNELGSQFLAIRKHSRFGAAIRQVEDGCASFLPIVQEQQGRLNTLWRSLSVQHDVPFFPSRNPASELP
jgi:hypothetical protein